MKASNEDFLAVQAKQEDMQIIFSWVIQLKEIQLCKTQMGILKNILSNFNVMILFQRNIRNTRNQANTHEK